MPTKKNTNKKTAKEEGYIYINYKPYKINQTIPSIDMLKDAVKIATFQNEYKNLIKIVDLVQSKMDALLSDVDDISSMLPKYHLLESEKDKRINQISDLLDSINNKIDSQLIYYLGIDVFESQIKSLDFLDKIRLIIECSSQNKNMTSLIKKELIRQ